MTPVCARRPYLDPDVHDREPGGCHRDLHEAAQAGSGGKSAPSPANDLRRRRIRRTIADDMNKAEVPTAQGGAQWYPATVRYVLLRTT